MLKKAPSALANRWLPHFVGEKIKQTYGVVTGRSVGDGEDIVLCSGWDKREWELRESLTECQQTELQNPDWTSRQGGR